MKILNWLFLFLAFSGQCQTSEYDGVDVTKLKGFTIYNTITEADVKQAKAWGANCLRLMIMVDDLYDYDESGFIKSRVVNFDKLEKVMDIVDLNRKYGITTILDLHEFPGLVRWSWNDNQQLTFWNLTEPGPTHRKLFVRTWKLLVNTFKDEPTNSLIFEILNEPEPHKGEFVWNELQDEVIKTIRAVDSRHTILTSPSWAWDSKSLRRWRPSDNILSDSKIAVAIHTYAPHEYTIQWEAWQGEKDYLSYPGEINGMYWNKDTLRSALTAIKTFQAQYPNIPIIITEFSVVRDAPGSDKFLADLLSLFKELNVGWTYHAFKEGDYYYSFRNVRQRMMWSLEQGDNKRLKIIKQNFK